MEASLRSIVHESLSLYVYPNAIFAAERLHSEFPTAENLHLLANCYISSGDAMTAHRLLNHHYPFGLMAPSTSTSDPEWRCQYLYGVSCAMTSQYQECERVLMELVQRTQTPNHAGVNYWLGVCARRLQRRTAGTYFVNAAGANLNLFTAYENAVKYYDAFEVNPFHAPLQSRGHHDDPTRPGSVDPHKKRTTTTTRSSFSPLPIKQSVAPEPVDGPVAVMALWKSFGDAAKALYSYKCNEAIAILTSPSMPQKNSGWVLLATALAFFHSGNYAEAVARFSTLRAKEPWRLNDPAIVLYSTALWHMRDEATLAHIAQVLVEEMPMSSITLSVVANCYSLVKDSKLALAMLQRATKLDPTHSYAHTLKGYEYMALDMRQEAESAFREAIRYDPRHYMAFAGLAELACRQESDQKARNYFTQALEINSIPPILNRFAATYHRESAGSDSLQRALRIYEQAISKWPKNYAARHHHADILIRLRRWEPALAELEQLKEDVPEEAQVHITLGKCLGLMGQTQRAVACYHRAMDLEPRRATYIKGCLERLASGKFDDEAD